VRFNTRCTACGLCVSACPTRVIQPALLAYGTAGLFQPTLDFAASFCNYDCVRCGAVCPTGAIAELTRDDKHRVQLGQVEFIEDNCVVVTDLTACGACAEHCPTKAVRMVAYQPPDSAPSDLPDASANLTIPELDQAICVGCGACEYACPTRPHRAIYVRGETVHGVAEPPPAEPLPELPAATGDAAFPF
jgi:ferredoxin